MSVGMGLGCVMKDITENPGRPLTMPDKSSSWRAIVAPANCQMPKACDDEANANLLSLLHMLVLHDAEALLRGQHMLSIFRTGACCNTS